MFGIEDSERVEKQRPRIIAALKSAGEDGITNVDLNKICFRYSSHIGTLRMKGYIIDVEHLGEGVIKYTLKYAPPEDQPKPEKAIEIFFDAVGEAKVDKYDLLEIIKAHGLNIVRKSGSCFATNKD